MSRSESWTVRAMLPATGWFARIDATSLGGEKFDSALVCWALVEFGEVVEVVGLMATDEVVLADEYDGFMCYIHESETLVGREEIAKSLDHAAWKGFNQSDSEFEKGYKHAMGVAAQVVRTSQPPPIKLDKERGE